jgi:mono/diheme cytochrome c family protein
MQVFVFKGIFLSAAAALLTAAAHAQAPGGGTFTPPQIQRGANVYANYCTPCHGERMSSAELFNLREFPKNERERFIRSVTDGKNGMPPWRGQLKPDEIEALWAYVFTGEQN